MASTPCPYCGSRECEVAESRPRKGGAEVQRRRRCLKCYRTHVTAERYELPPEPWLMARRPGLEYPDWETHWLRYGRKPKEG